jgi:hypothetical protein
MPPLGVLLSAYNSWKLSRDNSFSLLDRDDLIDWHVAQTIYLATWPGDFESVDFCALSQAKEYARVAGRHVSQCRPLPINLSCGELSRRGVASSGSPVKVTGRDVSDSLRRRQFSWP